MMHDAFSCAGLQKCFCQQIYKIFYIPAQTIVCSDQHHVPFDGLCVGPRSILEIGDLNLIRHLSLAFSKCSVVTNKEMELEVIALCCPPAREYESNTLTPKSQQYKGSLLLKRRDHRIANPSQCKSVVKHAVVCSSGSRLSRRFANSRGRPVRPGLTVQTPAFCCRVGLHFMNWSKHARPSNSLPG